MKPWVYVLFFWVYGFCGAVLYGQQSAQYSLFGLNPWVYNAGVGGMDGSLVGTAQVRKQWLGMVGSPLSMGFNVHAPIDYLSSGVGLGLERDVLGAYRFLSVQLAYNYFIPLAGGRLALGGSARFWQQSLEGSLLRTPDGIYEGLGINHNDVLLPLGRQSGRALTADAQVFYRRGGFWAGFSMRNLTEPTLELEGVLIQRSRQVRGYFAMLGNRFAMGTAGDWVLEPMGLLKVEMGQWQPEVQVWLHYREQFFMGLGYRGYDVWSQDALVVTAGWSAGRHYRLAYAYDLGLSALRGFHSGSHELVLRYDLAQPLSRELPQKVIYNPRYF